MKDTAIGLLGMSVDEFHGMTLGNFTRRSLGWVRNTWTAQRELIAVVVSALGEKTTGEDVFPFGLDKPKSVPTEEDREYMEKRHKRTLELQNG